MKPVPHGEPYAGKLHVRFDEGAGVPDNKGRPALLYSSFNGQYDEIRLRGGTLSADRIKADYDMIANRDFCTYGKVEGGAGK